MDPPEKLSVARLPDYPLVEILLRVSVKDLHQSKCVSKGWRDIIADPLHRKKLPQTLEGFFYEGDFIDLFGRSPPPVDPTFSFLKKVLRKDKIWLVCSCNGLLLFKHSRGCRTLGYIVCNPATEQWAAVNGDPADKHPLIKHTFLVFDPAVSARFHLVIFCEEKDSVATVHSYSSETGVWSRRRTIWAEEEKQHGHSGDWHSQISNINCFASQMTFPNGMLFLTLRGNLIAEVDVTGKTRRIIPAPPSVGGRSGYRRAVLVGQSQGRLHCINEDFYVDDIPSELSDRMHIGDTDNSDLLSIWVLQDYETQEWVLKHSVSCMRLFGNEYCKATMGYDIVAIHPDSNLMFIALQWKRLLVSYCMDSKEVRVVGTLAHDAIFLTPYVPCFLDLLSNY